MKTKINEMRQFDINEMREKVEAAKNVTIFNNSGVSAILGEKMVSAIKVNKDGGENVISIQGVFVEIGATANSELAAKLGVKLNEKGEIIIDEKSRTNVAGVFAAGDVANRRFKQAITGAAEGVIAAFSAYEDINSAGSKKPG